jgi:hypothetical protein
MKVLNTTLNDVFKSTPMGAIDNSIGNAFYGINHRQQPSAVPINKDSFGLTFFTRPQLNLSTPNIRSDRRFIPLLTNLDTSIQRIIRCYLDPRLNNVGNASEKEFSCKFVDNKNAFIPLLTNHLNSCSGWPDIALDTYTSKPGAYKEVYSQVDSVSDIYSAYDITATFRNMVADPITSMFFIWTLYQSLVFQGILVPYPDFIIKNEIDYNTRIYRLVLDPTRKYIQKIGCCGAAYPVGVPMGAAFNFENDKPINMSNNEIQITFKCLGACYQDDIIIHEFNKTVGIFNSDMRESTYKGMKKIPLEALNSFNNRGYPRINIDTYELEWYVSQEDYKNTMDSYTRHLTALST